MQSTFLRRAKGNHRRRHMAGGSHAAVLTVNATAMHAQARASNCLAEASSMANHVPRVRTKEKVKKTRKNPRESRTVLREAKHSDKDKGSTNGFSGLELSKSEANSESNESEQTYSTQDPYMDNSWCDDIWSYAAWNDGWSSVGWHEGLDQMYDNSASIFSLGSFDLAAMSRPKQFEWVRMNL